MAKTRWQIVRGDEPDAIFESPKGRRFAPGDWINLPPPREGTIWTVLAVEEAPGYDGRLILGNPTPRAEMERRAREQEPS